MSIPSEQVSPFARLIGARGVCIRYGISLRSVDRWLAKGILPEPDRTINTRRYWWLDSLERADRRHVRNAAAAATQPNRECHD